MDNQRYPEGCTAVVHSRAEACPLQGWYERRQSATLRHPTRKQGADCPSPPPAAPLRLGLVTQPNSDRGGWTGREVVLIPHQG